MVAKTKAKAKPAAKKSAKPAKVAKASKPAKEEKSKSKIKDATRIAIEKVANGFIISVNGQGNAFERHIAKDADSMIRKVAAMSGVTL